MPTPITIRDQVRAEALENGRDYVNSAPASAYLGVADSTLKFWRKKGVGPRYQKVGAEVRYYFDDLDVWLDAQFVESGVAIADRA